MRAGIFGRAMVGAVALLAFAGTGSAAASQRVFFGDSNSPSHIKAGTVAANGAVALDGGFDATAGTTGLGGIAVAPDGGNLFAASDDAILFDYAITSNGLSFVNSPDDDTNPYGVVTSPDGKHVYVAHLFGAVLQYDVQADGRIVAPPAEDPAVVNPTGLAMAPDGQHLFAVTHDGNAIPYSITPDGQITPGVGTPVGATAYSVSITPDGNTLYVPQDEAPNELLKFSINFEGALTQQGDGVPIDGGDDTYGSTITPDGKYLYLANYGTGTVAAYKLGAGAPVPVPGSPFSPAGLISPAAVTTNAAGTVLFVVDANHGSGDQTKLFSIAANGALTPGATLTTGVTGDFQSVALTPDQPPVASFTTSVNGRKVSFDGSDTVDPDSAIASYEWDFGDGKAQAGEKATPTHTYKGKGKLPAATLIATDVEGCSIGFVTAGQTPFCNGSGVARMKAVPFSADLSAKGTQKIGKKLKLKVGCDVDCSVKVKGKLKLKGGGKKSVKLKSVKTKVKAGKSKSIKIKLTGKARKAAAKAKKATAKLTVSATDAAGDDFTGKQKIKLK